MGKLMPWYIARAVRASVTPVLVTLESWLLFWRSLVKDDDGPSTDA